MFRQISRLQYPMIGCLRQVKNQRQFVPINYVKQLSTQKYYFYGQQPNDHKNTNKTDKTDKTQYSEYINDTMKTVKQQSQDNLDNLKKATGQFNIFNDKSQQEEKLKEEEQEQQNLQEKEEQTPEESDKTDDNVEKKEQTASSKVIGFLQDAWEQTFPTPGKTAKRKYERMKNTAKVMRLIEENQKQYSAEELESLQIDIPEWKRTAIQIIETESEQSSQGRFAKFKRSLMKSISNTETMKELNESEEWKDMQKELDDYTNQYSGMKEDIKNKLQNDQRKSVQAAMLIRHTAREETTQSKAITLMRKYEPGFQILEMEEEAQVIFHECYHWFLEGDLRSLEKVCSEGALGTFKSLLKVREAAKVEPKYKELWQIQPIAKLTQAWVSENNQPIFTFDIQFQEIHCNIALKDQQIVDGAEDRIVQSNYRFTLTVHMEPDLEKVGHRWEMVELHNMGSIKLLV